jgi:beta-N-acetylhexosaminidase
VANTKQLQSDIGQLLIVGFEEAELSPSLAGLLQTIQPAGVILFARNILTPQQTHKLLRDCRKQVTAPMFTCVDMEGGRVDRFRNVVGPSPSAADVFASGDRKLFFKHGKIIGACCGALGFNTDFAPVVDLALEASRTVMSSRAVSSDPKQAVIYAREFIAGLLSAGVLGAGKHFPGLGGANLDTHLALPDVNRSWKQLWQEDLYPYRAMRKDFSMVLVGHATYPKVTRDGKPASLSRKWITEVLRKKIAYRGLIVSDDLEMGGVLAAAPIEQAAIEHIRAGGDLCLICRQREFVERAHGALIKEAALDRRFARRLAESAAKIRAFKKRSIELKRKVSSPSTERIETLSRRLGEFSEQIRLKKRITEPASKAVLS